jgi:hypothetical protein
MDLKSVPELRRILYPGVAMESVVLWFLGSVMRNVVAGFTGSVRTAVRVRVLVAVVAIVVGVLHPPKPPTIWLKWTA